jgi:uncharacterized membrane protein
LHTFHEVIDAMKAMSMSERLNVGTLERWGSFAIGAVLVAYGLKRRARSGLAPAAAGAALLYRGFTMTADRKDTRVALTGSRGFHVHESIRVEQPVEEVYRFWRNLENLPKFMNHLEQVVDLGNGHSHWVANGPVGIPVEWDAEIINEVPNQVIGWRSLPSSDLVTAGSVNFDGAGDRRSTLVTVHLQYAPPGGRLGKVVAQLFGDEPAQAIAEDLRRLKRLLDARDTERVTEMPGAGGWQM